MKNRLDLMFLLQKYENPKFQNTQYDSIDTYPIGKLQRQNFVKEDPHRLRLQTQQNDQYQFQNVYNLKTKKKSVIQVNSNNQFFKSRQECSTKLHSILGQLKLFEQQITMNEKSYLSFFQNYYIKELQKSKSQLIELINETFAVQSKVFRQKIIFETKKQRQNKYQELKYKIDRKKQQTKSLLEQLNKKQYKPIIAEIVKKDFDSDLKPLIQQFQTCFKEQFVKFDLLDSKKLNCVQNDIKNIISLKYRENNYKNQSQQTFNISRNSNNNNRQSFKNVHMPDKIQERPILQNDRYQRQNSQNQSQNKLYQRQMSERTLIRRKSIFQNPKRIIKITSSEYPNQVNEKKGLERQYSESQLTKKSFFNFNKNQDYK